jgi:Predicted transporter component
VSDRHPAFYPLIVLGGLIEGFGLAYSGMARPEIVLDFLQFDDLGLVFVMGGAAVVSSLFFFVVPRLRDRAPLTGDTYGRRLKSMDRNVAVGGVLFGVGWGISGICPARPTRVWVSETSPFCGHSPGCSSARLSRASGDHVRASAARL